MNQNRTQQIYIVALSFLLLEKSWFGQKWSMVYLLGVRSSIRCKLENIDFHSEVKQSPSRFSRTRVVIGLLSLKHELLDRKD